MPYWGFFSRVFTSSTSGSWDTYIGWERERCIMSSPKVSDPRRRPKVFCCNLWVTDWRPGQDVVTVGSWGLTTFGAQSFGTQQNFCVLFLLSCWIEDFWLRENENQCTLTARGALLSLSRTTVHASNLRKASEIVVNFVLGRKEEPTNQQPNHCNQAQVFSQILTHQCLYVRI